MINIRAVSDRPQEAAYIANAWGETCIDELERLHQEAISTYVDSIGEGVNELRESWNKVQMDIFDFISESDEVALQQEKSALRNSLSARIDELRDSYRIRNRLTAYLDEVRSIRTMLEADGADEESRVTSNQNVIQAIKLKVFTMAYPDAGGPIQGYEFPITPSKTSLSQQIIEVETIISSLTSRIQMLDKKIDTLTSDAELTGGSADIDASEDTVRLDQRIQLLSRKQEEQKSRYGDLVRERSRHQKVLNELLADSLRASQDPVNTYLLARATIPTVAEWSVLIVSSVGGVLGLLAAVFLAICMNYMGVRPFLAGRG